MNEWLDIRWVNSINNAHLLGSMPFRLAKRSSISFRVFSPCLQSSMVLLISACTSSALISSLLTLASDTSPPFKTINIHLLLYLLIYLFIWFHSFICFHSFIHLFGQSVGHLLICSFIHASLYPCIHSFAHPSIHSIVH